MLESVKIVSTSKDSRGNKEHFLDVDSEAEVILEPQDHPDGLYRLKGSTDRGKDFVIQEVRPDDVEPIN